MVDLPAGPINHHWTKSLTASPDGSKLYVGVGSNSNAQERGPRRRRTAPRSGKSIRRPAPSGIFASGLRNPNGLTFYPGSKTSVGGGQRARRTRPNLVPDYLTSVRHGAFYGWPYSYWGQHVDPRVRPQRPDLVAKAIPPDYALSSHVAPSGSTFYTGASSRRCSAAAPSSASTAAGTATELNGYKVVFIRFAGGRPVGRPIDFVAGFIEGDGKARGRPVGVAVDRTGALIIADDVGNTVWRVSYSGSGAGGV